MRALMQHRVLLSLALSALVGTLGLACWPYPAHEPLLGLIAFRRPLVGGFFAYGYATLWFTTPLLLLNVVASFVYVFVARFDSAASIQPLPPYPAPETRTDLFVILGEQHLCTKPERAASPCWLVVPERGLYTGMIVVGAIGTGKTSACLYPCVEQLVAYRARDPRRKIGGLVLEVKGDFCQQVRGMLERHGRADDYIEISLDSRYRYNPLHSELDAYALAYGVATLMTNLYGRGHEPFWQQASTNLVKFVILLHQVLDDYVTLFQVYEHVINPDKLRARIAEGEERFGATEHRLVVAKAACGDTELVDAWTWHDDQAETHMWAHWNADLEATLKRHGITFKNVTPAPPEMADQVAKFEAVKRWFDDDWMRIEPKLRTSIVEGISVFLSLFDDNPRVKHTFCPPKSIYAPGGATDVRHGIPLPPLAELIEQGKVIALNFPIGINPGLARALGTMLKHDFQRAVLNRIPKMSADLSETSRSVFFVCDEYQAFATTGENEPSGDEKFFSLARQARCIPIVATQSISSLRSTLTGESWRTLLQGLRTKVFLALSDDASARIAADLCGKAERLTPGYTLTESGQDAGVSMLTGRTAARRSSVSASKRYTVTMDYVFQPKVFSELRNGQAVVLLYDGLNPQPATYCYLKPHYLKTETCYFDHVAAGVM